MKPTKSSDISNKMIEKIISVAYNDANVFERAVVYLTSLNNNRIKSELESYRRTARLVHALSEEVCPDKIFANSKINNLPKPEIRGSFITDLFSLVLNKPIASAFASLTVVLLIIATVIFNRQVERRFTDQEIQLADKQIKYALQLIGNIMNETQHTLKNEILTDRIAKPIHEGIEIVNTLLKEK